jgi:Ca-activated chloride channel homolog
MTYARIVSVILLLVSAYPIPAQEIRQQDGQFTVSVDVQLVQLAVSVLDKNGQPVSGLQKGDFQVFEDGVSQEISLFKHEDVPVSVGLVIDNSGSMRNKRERVNRAALAFVRSSNPQDETFIVNFDDSAYLEEDFTSTVSDLVAILSNLNTRGQTALYDAVYLSAEHLKEGKRDKKTMLLISDGEDNTSKYNLNKVLGNLRRSKATVYAIGLLEQGDVRGGPFRKASSKKARKVLEKFAETTGGRAYFPKSIDEIETLCKKIAHDIRNHYTLGYTSSNRKLDGSWRKITLRLNPPQSVSKVTIRAKEGYFAPRMQAVKED